MSLNLLLDSSLAKQQRTRGRQVSHDFTINFQPPIHLGSGNYKAALNKLITMSYSWYNIDASFGNNKIRWRKKTEDRQTLIFPNGMYGYSDFNSFFRPKPVKWTRKTKTVISFSLCISIWRYSGLSFWCMKIMSLTFRKAYSQNCLVMKKRFWREKRILSEQWSRISQEALIGCFSTAIWSAGEQTMFQAMFYTVFQQQGFRSVIRFKKNHIGSSGILWTKANNSVRIWVTHGRDKPLDLNGIYVAVNIMIEKE